MEQSANDAGESPVPEAVAGQPHPARQFRAPQVLPANLKSGQDRARSTKILMYGLAGLAVALIAVGVAAPQLTYASDASEYESLIEDTAAAAARTAQSEAELAAADLLLGKQYEEAAGVAGRLSQLAALSPEVLVPESSAVFATAAADVLAEIPKTQPPMSPRSLATLESTLGADPALRPSSWFLVEPRAIGELAQIVPDAPATDAEAATVSRAALDDARRQLAEQRADVATRSAELTARGDQSAQLRSTIAAGYTAVTAVAASVSESADAMIAKTPEAESLHDRLRAAVADVDAATANSAVAAGTPEDAAAIAQGAVSLGALEAYFAIATEAWGVQEKRAAEVAAARAVPSPAPMPMPVAPVDETPVIPEPPTPEPEPVTPEPPAPPTPSEEPPIDLAGSGAA